MRKPYNLWVYWGAGAVLVAAGLAIARWGRGDEFFACLAALRVGETLLPLAAAVQAAFALSPADEPALETFLACPRPLGRVLLERLAMAGGGFVVLGMAAGLLGLWLHSPAGPIAGWPGGAAVLLQLTRWAPPTLLFAGLATAITASTRQGINGTALTTVVWLGLALSGEAMATRWPQTWPINPYLQPPGADLGVYILNRAVVALLGVALALAAAWRLSDPEHVLGVRNQ